MQRSDHLIPCCACCGFALQPVGTAVVLLFTPSHSTVELGVEVSSKGSVTQVRPSARPRVRERAPLLPLLADRHSHPAIRHAMQQHVVSMRPEEVEVKEGEGTDPSTLRVRLGEKKMTLRKPHQGQDGPWCCLVSFVRAALETQGKDSSAVSNLELRGRSGWADPVLTQRLRVCRAALAVHREEDALAGEEGAGAVRPHAVDGGVRGPCLPAAQGSSSPVDQGLGQQAPSIIPVLRVAEGPGTCGGEDCIRWFTATPSNLRCRVWCVPEIAMVKWSEATWERAPRVVST